MYVYCVYVLCTVYMYCVLCVCTVYCVYVLCTVCMYCVLCVCTVYCVYVLCTVCMYCVLCICTVYSFCMCNVYSTMSMHIIYCVSRSFVLFYQWLLTYLEAGINLFLVCSCWCYRGPSVLFNNALVIRLCKCWVRVESASNPALSFSPPGPGLLSCDIKLHVTV